jgi:hypothetical protein
MACVLVLLGLLVVSASADAYVWGTGHTDYLTFNGAVALPNVILPAGTYTFENDRSRLEIVRVLSRDRQKLYFTGFTRPVMRPDNFRTNITFGEVEKGAPPRIATWYPMGDALGHQFIYNSR